MKKESKPRFPSRRVMEFHTVAVGVKTSYAGKREALKKVKDGLRGNKTPKRPKNGWGLRDGYKGGSGRLQRDGHRRPHCEGIF